MLILNFILIPKIIKSIKIKQIYSKIQQILLNKLIINIICIQSTHKVNTDNK